MAVLFSPMSADVTAELERRQRIISKQFQNDKEDLMWLHGRTPWVVMQSNAVFDDPKKASMSPSAYTLSSGWFKRDAELLFGEAYSPTLKRPFPGITEVNTKIKGHLGIMREVTVKFRAYTLWQLEHLQELFMIPGIGVLVEWGWAIAEQQTNTIPLRNITYDAENDRWLRETIKEKIRAGKGLYDAQFGFISNFNISTVSDGSWNCETTIVGPGAMIVDVNLKSPGNALDDKLKTFFEKEIITELQTPSGGIHKCAAIHGIQQDMSLYVSPSEQQEKYQTTIKNETAAAKIVRNQTNVYVSWEFIEATLNNFFKREEPTNFAKNQYIMSGVVDSGSSLIPCNTFNLEQGKHQSIWRSYSPTDVLIPKHPSSLDFEKTPIIDNAVGGEFRPFDSASANYGDFRAVWFNWHTTVKPAFENSETMSDTLNKILNKANDAAGGIWDIQLMYNENFAAYRIIDFKCTYNIGDTSHRDFLFPLNVKDSFVRSAEIGMVLPNAIKATVMIAANAPDKFESSIVDRDKVGIFRSLTAGVHDRFAVKMNSAPPKTSERSAGGASLLSSQVELKKKLEENKFVSSARDKGWNIELTGDEKSAAINFMYTRIEEAESSFKRSALIPLDVSITLDGIAGIVWGNTFKLEFVPNKYKENVFFQVTNIENTITSEGWLVTINAISRPKYHGTALAAHTISEGETRPVHPDNLLDDTSKRHYIEDAPVFSRFTN